MAIDQKRGRPESTGFRIWPGVTLIAVCAFLLFLTLYLISYSTHLIPLPEYVEALLQQNTYTEKTETGQNDKTVVLLPPQETDSRVLFDPAEKDPMEWLAAIQSPARYYQRMRIAWQFGEQQEEELVELYRMDACWKLIRQEKNSERSYVYLCDGTSLYREDTVGSEMVSPIGQMSPETLLGLPDLAYLQQEESVTAAHLPETRNLQFACQTTEGLDCEGVIALDTGLLMEVQIRKEDAVVLTMYTEVFDMAPVEIRQADFFTIPENGGNDQ